MQKINGDIKNGNYRQMYLLCGEEDYLRNQYRDRLKNALLAGGDEMNLSYYEGKDINLGQIVDLAETMPFLSERRVIIIENTGLFKSAGSDVLADYLKDCAPTTFFIFNEKEVVKNNKLYKAVNDHGYVGEFKIQDEQTLGRWIYGLVKQENKEMDAQAINLLLYKTGTDMANIKSELEKCICYCYNRDRITAADVEEICVERISNRIFDMINFLAIGNKEKALQLYYDLLALKEPPMRILSLITRQFNMLLQTRQLMEKGYDKRTMSEKLSTTTYVVGKYIDQAYRFKMTALREIIEACVNADADVKMGKLSDTLSVELLMIKCSDLAERKSAR